MLNQTNLKIQLIPLLWKYHYGSLTNNNLSFVGENKYAGGKLTNINYTVYFYFQYSTRANNRKTFAQTNKIFALEQLVCLCRLIFHNHVSQWCNCGRPSQEQLQTMSKWAQQGLACSMDSASAGMD